MKIKKTVSILLCVVFCFALLAGCGEVEPENTEPAGDQDQVENTPGEASKFADAESFSLRLSHSMSSTSFSQEIYTLFADTVREASEGTVDITVYPGSTLVSDAEAYDAVLSGNVEFAQFQASYLSGIMPELAALEIPGLYSGAKFSEVVEVTNEALDAIFAKYGVKYICPFPFSIMVFVGESCVTDPGTQLNGSLVRTSGAWSGRAVTAWGAAPMSINIGDVPNALERKTIDQVLTSWIATDGFKLYETGPHITVTNMQEILPGIMMNMDTWNAMTEAQQEAVMVGAEAFMTDGYDLMISEKDAFFDKMDELGVEVIYTDANTDKFFYDIAWDICDQLVEEVDVGELGMDLIEALRDPSVAP